jgi:flagellar M-ring protein FliF
VLAVPLYRYISIGVGVALIISIAVAFYIRSQQIEYRVLYSGFSDKDGGSIVAALEQMNIPYRVTQGGGALLVPAERVHDLRLRLASQGLPKASGVGFEVMENQRIGSSQFLEQVNFQRALEGELGRTIQTMEAVQHARVHLAIQRPSVFVRDQARPTASVLLTLYQGRALDRSNVNAVVHLVASSVPNLQASSVTVVDQNGDLLSWQDRERTESEKLDARQMEFVQELQKSIIKRVESILAPMVGENNVRAQATVEVDFSKSEQAEEIFRPNQAPNTPSIRSQQNIESSKSVADPMGGIPGAVTNQPPVPPIAPLIQQNPGQQQTAPPGQRVFTPIGQGGGAGPIEGKKESVINYEVDRTLRYVQKAKGEVRRITVAVMINYRPGKDADGKDALVPLTDVEKEEVADLVRGAMGYSRERGDSLSVLNTRFADTEISTPLWRDPEVIGSAKSYGKWIIIGAILFYLYRAFLKPLIYKLSGQEERDRLKKEAEEAALKAAEEERMAKVQAEEEERLAREAELADAETSAVVTLSMAGHVLSEEDAAYKHLLDVARATARDNPKVVANVIMEWLGND